MSVATAIQPVGAVNAPTFQTPEMIETAFRLAKYAANSNMTKVKSEFDAFFIIQYGWELGISPMTALRTIYSVNGTPVCSGEAMLSLIRRSGLAASVSIEGDNQQAVVTMTRKDTGESLTATFTMQDAATAGLTTKDNWKKFPSKMLKWRAVSEVAKFLFSDVIGGLYTVEEIDPDANLNEDGDIITIESTTPKNVTPMPKQETQEETPPKPKAWHENGELKQLISRAVEVGMGDTEKDLLALLDGQQWSDFASRADAANALKAAHEALQAELNKPTAEDEDMPLPQWTAEDNKEFSNLLKNHFDLTVDEFLAIVPDNEFSHDLSVHGSAQKAWLKAIAAAKTHQISVNSVKMAYNGKFVTFYTPLGSLRIYSRNQLAELAGEEWASSYNVTELENGEYDDLDPLKLSWEDKGNYKLITSISAPIPF